MNLEQERTEILESFKANPWMTDRQHAAKSARLDELNALIAAESTTQVATHVAYHVGRVSRIDGVPFYYAELRMARELGLSIPLQDATLAGWIAADGILARDARS